MSSLSKFDLCSTALLSVGARRIASFDDGTVESIVAGGLYDSIVEQELSRHRWNFAKRYFALNQLVSAPAHKWLYLWQLPADCLLLRALYVADRSLDYEQYDGRRVGTNEADPIAEYTGRISEDQWPAFFSALIRQRLEAHFFGALMKDPITKERMLADQDSPPRGFYHKARSLDAQEQPPVKLPKGDLASARFRR